MRTFAIGAIAIALLTAACATPASDDGDDAQELGSPLTTSPVTTSPVTTSPSTAALAPTSTMPLPLESVAPGGEQDDDPASGEPLTTVTTQPPKETPVKPIQPVEPVEPHPSGPVAAAIADLADRIGIDESAVTLVSHADVTWPDGSLGCPQPGMGYTQALVSGSLIILEVDGRIYEYHSGSGDPFYCATPTPPVSGGYGDT